MQLVVSYKGFTLFETVLYLALLSVLIGGTFVAAYQIIESNRRIRAENTLQAESDFVLRKIDWVLNDYTEIYSPNAGSTGNTLSVERDGTTITIELSDGVLLYENEPLTNTRVTVESFTVHHIAPANGAPGALQINFEMNGTLFGPTVRYLRS